MAVEPGQGENMTATLRRMIAIRIILLVFIGAPGLLGCAAHVPPEFLHSFENSPYQPGLAVTYFSGFYRHIDQMPTVATHPYSGRPGDPVMYIDNQFRYGEIFNSGKSRGIGVEMNGFIYFPSAGEYVFKAVSNDGVRAFVSDVMVVDDPDVHGDRHSAETAYQVSTPGWQPIRIQYYQRKGTATLRMYWRRPGADRFTIIPPGAYGHRPAKEV
jgi:hypothetical protein